MTSRVAGAGLALIAAALLSVAVATPVVLPGELALFAGPPTIDGHTQKMKNVYVGLLEAELCNTGGDGKCTSGVEQEKFGFRIAVLGELGATGLLAVAAVLLAILTLKRSERRKSVAKLIQLAGALAIAGAAAMLVQGPFGEAAIPIGMGMPLFGVAILCALIASLVAVRPPPPIKLRVADHGSQPIAARARAQAQAQPHPQPFDASALFVGDSPRGERGAEPRNPRARARVMAKGSTEAADSSDPFAPPSPDDDDRPPYTSPSQLRPLYEAAPQQGGTGGLLPIERPALPFQPSAPVARPSLSGAGMGPPRPMPADAEPPRTLPPPEFVARPRGKPTSVPPPIATFPVAPPIVGHPVVAPPAVVAPPVVAASPIAAPQVPPAAPGAPIASALAAPPIMPATIVASPMAPTIIAPPITDPLTDGPPMIAVPPSGPSPITQVSSVPPMPDNDLPIGPPTAIITSDRNPEGAASPPGTEPTLFPRPDTPLAPPPTPVGSSQRTRRASQPRARSRRESRPPTPPGEPQAPPRAHRESQVPPPPPRAHRESQVPPPPPRAQRESQVPPPPPRAQRESQVPPAPPHDNHAPPRPHRESQVPPVPRDQATGPAQAPTTHAATLPPPARETQLPRTLRAAVPMPARPGRPAPGPTQPPPTASAPIPPPRPTLSATVPPPPVIPAIPPIPAIPAIPPIPALPRRAEAEPTAIGDLGDIDQATISRVPIEIADNFSPTSVSYEMPPSEEVAGDTSTLSDDRDVHATSIDDPGAAHLRTTVPFTVPDTAPTGEPTMPADGEPTLPPDGAHRTDANGEAVTVPARAAVTRPQAPPPRLAIAPAAPTPPAARDRGMSRLPLSTAPESLPPPRDNKQHTSGPSPACPQCESPMAWVEEHLRFYCKSCRMYF